MADMDTLIWVAVDMDTSIWVAAYNDYPLWSKFANTLLVLPRKYHKGILFSYLNVNYL